MSAQAGGRHCVRAPVVCAPAVGRDAAPHQLTAPPLRAPATRRYSLTNTGGVWTSSSAYTIAGETGYSGVSLSTDHSVVYVTASHGIYALTASTGAWFSASPVVVAAGTGANQVRHQPAPPPQWRT